MDLFHPKFKMVMMDMDEWQNELERREVAARAQAIRRFIDAMISFSLMPVGSESPDLISNDFELKNPAHRKFIELTIRLHRNGVPNE